MAFSTLYYTILNKPFFIDVRRIDAQAVLIDMFLEHDIPGFSNERLSDAAPVARVFLTSPGPSCGRGDDTIALRHASGQGHSTSGDFSKAPEGSVAVIPLRGDMMKEGTMCGYGTEEIAAVIREAADTRNIIGIRLDIDSGGGAVDAIPPMLDAIAYSQASAAYYVASHCDSIVAVNNISAEFGSIGVMMQFPDYAKYYEQKGIKIHTIYSDLSDYKNAPFEAARKGDYKAIKQEMLNPLALQFQEAVKAHRKELKQDVDGILNGRVFYARQALDYGLIDRIGTVDTATEEVRRLSAKAALEQYAASL